MSIKRQNSLMKKTAVFILFLELIAFPFCLYSQEPVTVARIKYGGGGDWYGNRTTFVNLFRYAREKTNMLTADREV
ncbi:MAG: hypothetical protein P8184_13455, partial [Calditrichia bacterium]